MDFTLGSLLGLTVGLGIGTFMYHGLVYRMEQNGEVRAITKSLELHRLATDYGRDTTVNPLAGESGKVVNLFATRPGAMMRSRMSQKKLPENLDRSTLFGRLKRSGSIDHDSE